MTKAKPRGSGKGELQKAIGTVRLKTAATTRPYNSKNEEKFYIPKSIEKYLNDENQVVFENLNRGLRVSDKERGRAKSSLHYARKSIIKKMKAYCYTDSEICLELEINGTQLQNYKKAMYKEEIEALKKSTPEEQFIEYRHNQMEVVKDIDTLIERFRDNKMVNAISNALKTKSEILKDIANRAQEMGFMEKKIQELKIINDVDLATLSTDQLFDLVQKQQRLVNKVARGNVTNITEIKNSMKVEEL